jgi:hypothetical protein
MQEQRTSPRKQVTEKIDIIDINRDEYLGNLVNISAGGFMLLCSTPPPTNQLFQVRMSLPTSIDHVDHIDLGAECLWCNAVSESGSWWAGFQIIDISDQGIRLIEQLFAKWTE